MAPEWTGRQLVKAWFENLERRLTEEAKHAGLLGHPTLTGNAREFFVRQVLSTFLPGSLRIGTGRVIGAESGASRQVDVIVFDTRFPALNAGDGTSLYPVEGVIAAIEVKSALDSDSLRAALDNCWSVAAIAPGVLSEDLAARRKLDAQTGLPLPLGIGFLRSVVPRTYVFAFTGLKSPDDLKRTIVDWLKAPERSRTHPRLSLPSIIVTGGAVAVGYRDPITQDGGEFRDSEGTQVDNSAVEPLMWVLEAKQRFGWLAAHLLFAVEQRRLQERGFDQVHLVFERYLPFQEYFSEYAADKPKEMIVVQTMSQKHP
jgi:hypothetical protein